MARQTRRRAVIAGAAAVLAGLGITGVAAAQNGPGDPAGPSADRSDEGGHEDPSYTGSIPAPDDGADDGTESEADEAAEAQALQALATISADRARDAALTAVPGTAATVGLDNENGSVVYSVEVTGADGTVTDVKVDAGNGKVLAQDSGEDSEADEASGAEQPDDAAPAPAG
jgi:hypothetical protein